MAYTDEQIKFILDNYDNKTWQEIQKEYNKLFNENKTENALRKAYKRYQDIYFSDDTFIKNYRQTLTARKRASLMSKENKLIIEHLEAQEEFLNEFERLLKKNPLKIHKPVKHKKSKKKIKRATVMHLSDTHIQSMIEADEMGGLNNYTEVEEARRLALFTNHVADYKLHYRDDSELVVVCNGDLGAGVIHNQETLPPITTQFSAMLHLLTQSLSYLATKYRRVRVLCTVDNHLRVMHKTNKARVSNQKWDSFATMLHISLKYALSKHENIEFEIPVAPYIYTQILGHNFLIMHGDTIVNIGNPNKSLNPENIKNMTNDLINSIGPIDVLMLGHVHTGVYQQLNNGVELLINGCMSGVDGFAQSIGILKSIPTQQMFEVTQEHPIGDVRFVGLGEADNMKELDKIITPFKGKF